VSSAGIARHDQPPFDQDLERRDPWWSDQSWRPIPAGTSEADVGIYHLHIDPRFGQQERGPTMAQLIQTPVEQLTERDEARSRRRRGAFWTALAAVEVLLAAVAVLLHLFVPTIIILALAGISLALRREGLGTLGVGRSLHPWRMAIGVFGLVVVWSLLQLGLFMPILNHLTGTRQDLSQFADLQGNLGMLAGFLLLTWTLAAFGEELVYRGYLQTRITDVLGPNLIGVVAAVGVSSVLFGLIHTEQGIIGVVVTLVDALFFSFLRLRYRTLWASVLAHGFNNTIGLITFFLIGPIYGFW
jgi:uncharacterized protein